MPQQANPAPKKPDYVDQINEIKDTCFNKRRPFIIFFADEQDNVIAIKAGFDKCGNVVGMGLDTAIGMYLQGRQ